MKEAKSVKEKQIMIFILLKLCLNSDDVDDASNNVVFKK